MNPNLLNPVVRAAQVPTGRFAAIEPEASGVSWAAVVAGAFAIAAVSLALLALGAGVGFSSVSPWAHNGASESVLGWSAIGWLVVMQLVTCSLGGYLAGRLRTRWTSVHGHEVYFRDTAHGFLSWAVGLVMTAAFLTSAAGLMAGNAAGPAASAAVNQSADRPSSDSDGNYLIDTMLRTTTPAAGSESRTSQGEIGRIFANSLKAGSLAAADRAYLTQVVASRTGVTEAEAQRRVDDADLQFRQGADAARKAVAHSLYWTFLALLVGAFTASVAATIGGRQRDLAITV